MYLTTEIVINGRSCREAIDMREGDLRVLTFKRPGSTAVIVKGRADELAAVFGSLAAKFADIALAERCVKEHAERAKRD